MAYRDHHATIFLPALVAQPIEGVRRAWDPVMAGQIAAHVTVAYPQEAPLAKMLGERVQAASATMTPFRLRLGTIACFERPEGGVYVEVEDPDGGYNRLRAALLGPPFLPLDFPPHVTLIHPRTSTRGPAFWEQRPHHQYELEFTVGEIAITAFDDTRWVVVQKHALSRFG